MMQRRSLLLTTLALAACSAEKPKPAFKNIDITGAAYAKALSLPDVNGKVRTLADFNGKVIVVFFGFGIGVMNDTGRRDSRTCCVGCPESSSSQ